MSRARKDHSWLDAIASVLSDAEDALRVNEIADAIAERSLRSNIGATPARTVAAVLSANAQGDESLFVRSGRGLYELRAKPSESPVEAVEVEDQKGAGFLQAAGAFWSRARVRWKGPRPALWGQQSGGKPVNFSEQVGVYLLHDRDRVLYVGRADTAIGERLFAHTKDRLSGRWDRFSWFGLRTVSEDGSLGEVADDWPREAVVEVLEAALIESLEPPLNRRRGDRVDAIEYQQSDDQKLLAERRKALLGEMLEKLE